MVQRWKVMITISRVGVSFIRLKPRITGIFFTFFLFVLLLIQCNREIKTYIQSKNNLPKVYIEPVVVDIDIRFLSSISSEEPTTDLLKETIRRVSHSHALWFENRLREKLLKEGIIIEEKEKAKLFLSSRIVDMGEIRPKMFIGGLSIGLMIGLLVVKLTGKREFGIAILAKQVVEESVKIYLLKSYFTVTTIDIAFSIPGGNQVRSKEFTAFSNNDYLETLPELSRKLKENKVRASLDKNATEITVFLKELTSDD